jgi:PAS domain S-box-containing protein
VKPIEKENPLRLASVVADLARLALEGASSSILFEVTSRITTWLVGVDAAAVFTSTPAGALRRRAQFGLPRARLLRRPGPLAGYAGYHAVPIRCGGGGITDGLLAVYTEREWLPDEFALVALETLAMVLTGAVSRERNAAAQRMTRAAPRAAIDSSSSSETDAGGVDSEVARALHASETRYRRLAESGIIGLAIGREAGSVVEANDTFLSMVGYSRAELAAGALCWRDLSPPEWRQSDEAACVLVRAHGVARPWEKEYVRRDGSRVPVLVALARLEGPEILAISLDLSEQKRLEKQFLQAQKIDAIGRLAGGIAHDFNNLLSVILSYTELMLTDLPPNEAMRCDIAEINRAGRRAAQLTDQLLAFSRRQMVEPRLLDPSQSVLGMETLLRRLVGEDVELSFHTAPQTGRVLADPGQLEQVILNLVVNARDAMPRGGKVSVETANIDLDLEYAAEHVGVLRGPHVMIAVSDTGVGMDAETRARIFEPFFTTKEVGKGTGLGLATVFGIVKQAGGHIFVYSERGIGTTFKVYFPRVEHAEEAPPVETTPTPSDALGGTETILLVEDEDQVRGILRAILRRHGYQVLEAQNGGEALLACEQHEGEIHLLLTDVVMPRMSGRALAERLSTLRKEMRVLYVSGYTEESVIRHGVLNSDVAFLEKPITPLVLIRKVREVLDGPRPGKSSQAADD